MAPSPSSIAPPSQTSPSPAASVVEAPIVPNRVRQRLLLTNRRIARTLTEPGRYALLGWLVLGFISADPSHQALRWAELAISTGWAMAFVWWFYNRRGVFDVRREAPRWLTAGHGFQYTLRMTHRRGPLGPWVVRDEQALVPYAEERQMRSWLHLVADPYHGARWAVGDTRPTGDDDACAVALDDPTMFAASSTPTQAVQVQGFARRRGLATLTSVRWGRTDPLGWLQAGGRADLPAHTFVIIPSPTTMPPWPSDRARRAQQRRPEERSSQRHRNLNGEEWAGLREARPDDPMKHTHWKSWARTGRRWVVEKEDPTPTRLSIVLDPVLDASPEAFERFERLLEMMAGQALNVRSLNDVDWVMIDGEPVRAEGQGSSAWDQVMLKLAVVQPCSNAANDERWNALSTHWDKVVALRLLSTRGSQDPDVQRWVLRWEAMGIDVEVLNVPTLVEVVS